MKNICFVFDRSMSCLTTLWVVHASSSEQTWLPLRKKRLLPQVLTLTLVTRCVHRPAILQTLSMIYLAHLCWIVSCAFWSISVSCMCFCLPVCFAVFKKKVFADDDLKEKKLLKMNKCVLSFYLYIITEPALVWSLILGCCTSGNNLEYLRKEGRKTCMHLHARLVCMFMQQKGNNGYMRLLFLNFRD